MRRVALASWVTFAFVACGGGGDGGTDPNNQQQTDQVTQTIGPAGGTVVTPAGAAGVQIPAGTFTQPVSVTVSRIEVTTQPGSGPLATSLKQYGPFYEFTTSPQVQTFGDSVRVGVCQVTDPSSPNYAPEPHSTLRLAHTVGNSIEILEPVDVSSFLRCTNVSGGSSTRSLFARALGKIFNAPMLYAAHGGLGGKTKSFSPFGAVQLTQSAVQFANVSAGSKFSCATTTSGSVYCWGLLPQAQTSVTQPTAVSSSASFGSVAAIWGHACALSTAGRLFCWGQNNYGQVGDGTTNTVSTPQDILASAGFATGISPDHTCALDATRRAFCWGRNNVGQLGTGSVDENAHTRPEAVAIQGATPTTWSNLSMGPRHVCGSSGTFVFCWGDNNDGKLGDGSTTNRSIPTKVASNIDFSAVSAGLLHSCALAASGAAYCWGQNFYGQLGGGSQPNNPQANELVPVPVVGGLTFKMISAGNDFTCGVTSSGGQAYCWGRNNFGQLGDLTTTDRRVPTLVAGAITWESISAGDTHTCGRSTGGIVYCWGDNSSGQIGNGSTQNANIPARVNGQQ